MWNILVQCRLRALLLLIVLVALAALPIASGLPAGTSDGKYSSHLIHVPHSTSGPCSDDADERPRMWWMVSGYSLLTCFSLRPYFHPQSTMTCIPSWVSIRSAVRRIIREIGLNVVPCHSSFCRPTSSATATTGTTRPSRYCKRSCTRTDWTSARPRTRSCSSATECPFPR